MNSNQSELQQLAAQLLTGLLANPHVYPSISDERSTGQQEQELILMAIEMAEQLMQKVATRSN